MSIVQNCIPLVGLALYIVQEQPQSTEMKCLKNKLNILSTLYSLDIQNQQRSHWFKDFDDLVKESPFLKYSVKRVSVLDIPHRNVNLQSLEIHNFKPDWSVSPGGISSDRSDKTCPSTGDLDLPLKSILKKPHRSCFKTKEESGTSEIKKDPFNLFEK